MIEYESIGSNLILPYLMAESLDKNFFKIKDEFKNWMDNYAKVYQTNHRSNVNGFQSPDDFYMEKSFSPFLNYMSERILDLVDEFKLNEESSINCIPRLSNMWFNINYTGSYNTAHTHPGSILAGVLYVDVPKMWREMVEKIYPKSAVPWEAEATWAGKTEGMTQKALEACAAGNMWEVYPPTPLTRAWLEAEGFIK